jgi:tetratricopeptide (TPR) repeat protein
MKPLPLIFAGAAITATLLLCDYPNWQAREAEKKAQSGDFSGALADLATVEKVPGRAAVARFNRGVVLCRMGNYSGAILSFKRAVASGESGLRSRALYNLGTTRVIAAGKSATARTRAEALLKDAVADLQQCLALDPSDEAAKANLKLAQEGLVALAKANREERKDDTAESQQRQERDRKQARRQGAPKEPDHTAPKPGQATDLQQERGRRRLVAVDRNQALRMLDDARGREALRSSKAATGGGRGESQPEKDW